MASRLVPLLIAGTLAAAGCGASGMSSPTTPVAGSPQHGRPALAGPVRKAHATIWAVGDSAGGQDAASVAHLIERGRPDRLLYLGDVYPVGNAAGFRSYQSAYGSMRAITAPTPGNHDWLFRRSGYEPYWHNPPEWYSFTAAGWRIIELNSETTRGQAQLRWLRSQVHARGSCRIAFWHRPRFSAGTHGDNQDMDPYWRALARHATLVVSGHDHDMQRFAPRDGLSQLVAGAGGFTHYPVDRSHPGLQFADATHWGALRIDLTRHAAKVAFVAVGGRVLDSRSYICA